MNNVKISVITGVYHPNKNLFRKFLHSCLNQTLVGIQFVMILDDPEDKESREILEEYKENIKENKNTFTILENDKNLGIYATQMKGLQNSLGEYIVFFDNDDFFDLEYLEVMYKYAKEFDANVTKGYALTHYFGDIDLNFAFICNHENITNEDDWLYMYKREFFIRNFYYSKMYTSDTAISKKIDNKWLEKEIILQIPFYEGVFYHYVRHCNNTSTVFAIEPQTNDDNEDLADRKRIHERFMKDFYEEFDNTDNLTQKLQNKLKLDIAPNNYNFDQLKDL